MRWPKTTDSTKADFFLNSCQRAQVFANDCIYFSLLFTGSSTYFWITVFEINVCVLNLKSVLRNFDSKRIFKKWLYFVGLVLGACRCYCFTLRWIFVVYFGLKFKDSHKPFGLRVAALFIDLCFFLFLFFVTWTINCNNKKIPWSLISHFKWFLIMLSDFSPLSHVVFSKQYFGAGGGHTATTHSALWEHAARLGRGKRLDIRNGWLAAGTMQSLLDRVVATGRGGWAEMDTEIRPEHTVTR